MKEDLFIPLVCSRCGKELLGGDNSIIFFCLECKIGFIMENYPESLPLKIYKKNFNCEGELIYFPFYKIEGDFSFFSEDSHKTNSYSNLKKLGALFYPAFINLRSLYSEDLTLKYALQPYSFVEDNYPKEAVIIDVLVAPKNLEKIAKLFYLSYFDRAADVTNVEVDFTLKTVDFALIPFEKKGDEYRELILGTILKGFSI
ncbi:MAG: hypothetical protein GYA35_05960 [Thermoanaerobaculaceae bacterium]|nr:hypothetical protein [Thermoanaerobaculaceae bacterium]